MPSAATHVTHGPQVRQEFRQMRTHGHRTHARSTAAVGDAESLVQIQVRDVAAELTGCGEAHHGVQVGAVHVHLAAVLVHDLADLAYLGLEHAVGRGIGDHDGGEIAPCAPRPWP